MSNCFALIYFAKYVLLNTKASSNCFKRMDEIKLCLNNGFSADWEYGARVPMRAAIVVQRKK